MSLSRRTFLLAGAGLAATACAGGPGSEATPTAPAPPSPTRAPTTATPTSSAGAPTTAAPGTTAAGPPQFVVRGPDRAPGAPARVALTFHTDGRTDLAARLTDALRGGSAVATCFIVGSWLDKNPGWAAQLRDAGHELANHTYTHPDSDKLSVDALTADLTRCRDVLVRLTGSPGRFFRPSGTDDGTAAPAPSIVEAAAAAGYREIAGFDVDPLDYRDPGSASVTKRTLDAVRPGSIVSLHFGHPGTVEALPAILRGLRDRGLEPVTLGTLLG